MDTGLSYILLLVVVMFNLGALVTVLKDC